MPCQSERDYNKAAEIWPGLSFCSPAWGRERLVGLLHKLGSLVEKPVPLDVADDPQTVLAPVSGQVVALEDLAAKL